MAQGHVRCIGDCTVSGPPTIVQLPSETIRSVPVHAWGVVVGGGGVVVGGGGVVVGGGGGDVGGSDGLGGAGPLGATEAGLGSGVGLEGALG